MHKLSKSEFMSKVVNDLYENKRQEKEKLRAADIHTIENRDKINKYIRRKKSKMKNLRILHLKLKQK